MASYIMISRGCYKHMLRFQNPVTFLDLRVIPTSKYIYCYLTSHRFVWLFSAIDSFRDSIMCDTRTRKRYAKRTRYTWALLLVSTATCNHTIAWYVFHVSIPFQVHVFQFIKNVFEFHLIEFIVCGRHTFNVQRTDICSTRELEKSTHKPE